MIYFLIPVILILIFGYIVSKVNRFKKMEEQSFQEVIIERKILNFPS